MPPFWLFAPWLPYSFDLGELVNHCEFLNGDDVFDARPPTGRTMVAPHPVVQLALTLDTFDVDCFLWESRILVSERMRSVMALKPSGAQYFQVDASASSGGPRAMNYSVMHVTVTEDASDLTESDYLSGATAPRTAEIPMFVNSIVFRPGFVPRHELFHDRHFLGYQFCTDGFAMRLLQAGCTGVRFFDPSYLGPSQLKQFRTLRGIEEEGDWDSVAGIERTRLVHPIE